MPRTTDPRTLRKMIDSLRSQRQNLLAKLSEIDSTFEQLGISAEGGRRRRGRPAGTAARGATKRGRRRKRRRFSSSGEDSVLNFVRRHGKPNAAEVNRHWQSESRGGKADNALSRLVKHKKLKRITVKDERGGRYVVVE